MNKIQAAAFDRRKLQILQIWAQALVIIAGLAAPLLFLTGNASAAQLTSRSVTIGTSVASASTTYTYGFTLPTAGNVQSISFQACTTPLGSCTSPGGSINMDAGTEASRSGWSSATTFTRSAGGGSCTGAVNMLCVSRSAAVSESGARTLGWNSQVNPTTLASYFVRIVTYSDTGWATPVDSGVVAYAIISQLTVNARIQEILNFCVGTTTVDDATTSPGTDCSAISGTTVDIGVLDATTINVSPVSTNGGSNTNGIAMLRTNAQSGAIITYFAEQNSSSGKLKVAGQSCTGTITTDQCINSQGTTQGTFTAGVEKFGMTVAGVNCSATTTTSYSCAFASNTNNLKQVAQYTGNTTTAYGVTNGYAWDDTGTVTTIATSAGSAVKVVDDESIIMKFAATPSITTPTGAYTVTSTYVATATY